MTLHHKFSSSDVEQRIASCFCNKVFPAEQAASIEKDSDTACGADRVESSNSVSCNVPGGCTTLIKISLVYHAYEQLFKER
jgi:hypothetical protein